jgi:hypothetical protein
MKKIFILVLMVLVGFGLFLNSIKAEEARTIFHNFKTYTASTSGTSGKVIYRITGVTTAANGVFGIYNAASTADASTSNCAIEGGEGTAGDALPHYDFGPDGLKLDTGSTVLVSNCYVTIEYL